MGESRFLLDVQKSETISSPITIVEAKQGVREETKNQLRTCVLLGQSIPRHVHLGAGKRRTKVYSREQIRGESFRYSSLSWHTNPSCTDRLPQQVVGGKVANLCVARPRLGTKGVRPGPTHAAVAQVRRITALVHGRKGGGARRRLSDPVVHLHPVLIVGLFSLLVGFKLEPGVAVLLLEPTSPDVRLGFLVAADLLLDARTGRRGRSRRVVARVLDLLGRVVVAGKHRAGGEGRKVLAHGHLVLRLGLVDRVLARKIHGIRVAPRARRRAELVLHRGPHLRHRAVLVELVKVVAVATSSASRERRRVEERFEGDWLS